MAELIAFCNNTIANLSDLLSLPEPALRFLIAVLAGFPLAFFQRSFLHGKSATLHHAYFVICGLMLSYFNYGAESLHSASSVFINYLLIYFAGGTDISIIISFIFNMGYLVTGYIYTATDTYDITWTMPHCILTLRLIGLNFDVYDGSRPPEEISNDQKMTMLVKKPSLLEIAGYTYYFGGFFSGPQFPMRRYFDMCNGVLTDGAKGERPNCVAAAMKKLALGTVLSILNTVIVPWIPESYFLTNDFAELEFYKRLLVLAAWSNMTLFKYMLIWCFAEGTCILSGLAYNGRDKDGNALWDACENIKMFRFLFNPSFRSIVKTFNTNTNQWVLRYVYKRLKFLGNRKISQACTLFFLALWHGLSSGYYMTFMMEFVITNVEDKMVEVANKTGLIKLMDNPITKVPTYLVCKLWQLTFMGYPLLAFNLLTWRRQVQAYSAVYWCGHIFYMVLFPALYIFVLNPLLTKPKPKSDVGTKPKAE
ncbi:lysophospholipid acyltransferase 5-like [Saccoglossus kowalevskii]|uniref:Lysophospholipid acyltransferase 5 n=1 Tax=Saccoglossus kowalevskii TaxID=10224 RepID=A0ABM0M514_SACKO|nr:PREDICTED: lysophospholipid acyltransferase 5-like [Saccoglossus kowalevskii]